ncbi:GGDEF domain-containing protein [Rubrobacter aplysinae]|uniref:GGDEF domain-containing protein n=1 Tax=Rubrobacter aplysinae TaxID=909625 RepID=UPI000AFF6582|nr:GGDEF domain-containing protein [Rubrobacter aplysinae]
MAALFLGGVTLGYGAGSVHRFLGARSLHYTAQPRGDEPFASLALSKPGTMFVLDGGLTVRHALPAVQEVLGHSPGQMTGRKLTDYLHPADIGRFTSERGKMTAEVVDFRMRHADGSWCGLQATRVVPRDEPAGDGGTYRVRLPEDPGVRNAPPRPVLWRDPQDPGDILDGREIFVDRIESVLAHDDRHARHLESTTLILLGIDTFEAVDDALGLAVGDQMLYVAGMRLRSCLRPEDTLARVGRGEFGVLPGKGFEVGSAIRLAERISESLKEPILLGGRMLHITASVGIVSSEATGLGSGEDFMAAAASAVRGARENGAGYEIFGGYASEADLERLKLEGDLWRAAERGQLALSYQPQVDLESGEVVGVEALLRWEYPRRGTVTPEEFIDLVEDTGLIVPIGTWALREACRSAVRWRQNTVFGRALISVNLSARQFQQPGLAEEVSSIMEETGIEPERLVLEITESLLLDDTPYIAESLQKIKGLGVRLALDDFGTGYSSLSYLQRIPVDYLKIDQSFVSGLEDGGEDAPVFLSAIVEVARTLGIKTIAEGLETEAQVERLRELRCDMGQGYYFARPMPEEEAYGLVGSSLHDQGPEISPEDWRTE